VKIGMKRSALNFKTSNDSLGEREEARRKEKGSIRREVGRGKEGLN